MKKILFMFALMMGVVSANAQIATQNSNFFDNISVGATAGVSTPLDFNSVFPLNTNLGIKIAKDFTPVVGLQIEALGFLNDNHFGDLKTAFKATNLGVNSVINLSNLFGGYQGTPRAFEISTVTGLGWMRQWEIWHNSLSAKVGLDLSFNLGKNKAHSIVLTPALYYDLNRFSKIQFNKQTSQLALNLSYVYHFKNSNGTHSFKTYDIGAMIDEINRLNGALDECEKRTPQVVEKIVEVKAPVTDVVAIKSGNDIWVVTFETGRSVLTNEAKFILNQVGNDIIVDVTATASPDGSAEFNQKLSEMRAATVADFLTKRGVKVNSFQGKGVDIETGRSAIVKTLQ